MADETDTEHPAAKRQKTGNLEGFGVEPDVALVVESEEFKVHSLILMMVSPVFRQMLTHGMGERLSRVIQLPDKKKDEFKVFWDVIQPMTTCRITNGNANRDSV